MPDDAARIENVRDLFAIPPDITYLNCSYMSPQLRALTEIGRSQVERKERPWEIVPKDWFETPEKLRGLAGALLNADADSIAFVPSVSYGMAAAARNLPVARGQEIIVLDQEYPSGYYAWQEKASACGAKLRVVSGSPAGWTPAILDAISHNTAVVVAPNCHWTDGSLVDLEEVGRAARSVGAAFVIDASQSLGARPLDLKKVRPDFLVTVGYKWLLGPYGLGYLYVDERWQDQGKPVEIGWLAKQNSEDFARLVDYREEYKKGARRFDMGEYPVFTAMSMAVGALGQVLSWSPGAIASSIRPLTGMLAAASRECGLSVAEERADHMIGIGFRDGISAGLTEALAREKVIVSTRGNNLRVSPHLYNSEEDIDRLIGVLRRFT